HAEGQFSGGNGIASRRVHHYHAVLSRRLNVDVIRAHSRSADDLQLWSRLDDLAGDLGFGTDNQADRVLGGGHQFCLRQAVWQYNHYKFGPLLKKPNPCRGDGITNQNFNKRRGSLGKAGPPVKHSKEGWFLAS